MAWLEVTAKASNTGNNRRGHVLICGKAAVLDPTQSEDRSAPFRLDASATSNPA